MVPIFTNNHIHPWLDIKPDEVITQIISILKDSVHKVLKKKGAVVAISGGIDSSVCAALTVEAFGRDNVYGLLLPESDSSPNSMILGEIVCKHLNINYEVINITPVLEAFGCYNLRDNVVASLFPDYNKSWKYKIVLNRNEYKENRLNHFIIVVETNTGDTMEKRLPIKEYLHLVSATNYKQRVRKTYEYYYADRMNYAVIGTPNRLEYDQGFFVKNGDGSADIKPIAHLYKSQVYLLGRALGLPETICDTIPTTDTYSMKQSQDEFYFVLPYQKLDIILWGLNNNKTAEEIAFASNITKEQVIYAIQDIIAKRKSSIPIHLSPILIENI
ncbi:MAG TPA: NAD(+) synthase [Candidatus Deferrimicrobiaceae bacterium]|jgi:NAD+ synthase